MLRCEVLIGRRAYAFVNARSWMCNGTETGSQTLYTRIDINSVAFYDEVIVQTMYTRIDMNSVACYGEVIVLYINNCCMVCVSTINASLLQKETGSPWFTYHEAWAPSSFLGMHNGFGHLIMFP